MSGIRTALLEPAPSRVRRAAALLFVAAVLVGCGSSGSGQSGSAFVFLTVDGVSPAVATSSLAANTTSTVVCFTLRNNLKNPTVTATTSLDNVVMESYTVKLSRPAGGPVPGPFSFSSGGTIPAGGSGSVPVIVVPAQRKGELGGATGIATAEVAFSGRDLRGQRVSTQGSVLVDVTAAGSDSTGTNCASTGYGASLFAPVRPVYALLSLVVLIGLVAPQLARRNRRG